MNEQLQSALIEILNRTVEGIDSGVAFMMSELPDVIEQLLMWHMLKGVILTALGFILIIPLFLFLRLLSKQDIKGAKEDSFWVCHYHSYSNSLGGGATAVLISLSLVSLCGLAISFLNFMTPIQILVAPKIWLIEYAAKLAS